VFRAITEMIMIGGIYFLAKQHKCRTLSGIVVARWLFGNLGS